MANDNRKPPHRHDPELARKEALQARQTHTHRSGQKESGHRQTTSRVNKRPSTHSSATSRRKTSKKFQISAGTTSENDACGRRISDLASCNYLLCPLLYFFQKSRRSCCHQKAQEAAQAKNPKKPQKQLRKILFH